MNPHLYEMPNSNHLNEKVRERNISRNKYGVLYNSTTLR